ncbi:MAG TPA: hypothetical protein PLA68_05860, partial [Panacibacter sp.]|nr:hypothetical protein [Panacibacter sp.]
SAVADLITKCLRFHLRCGKGSIRFPNVQVCDARNDAQSGLDWPILCLTVFLFSCICTFLRDQDNYFFAINLSCK